MTRLTVRSNAGVLAGVVLAFDSRTPALGLTGA